MILEEDFSEENFTENMRELNLISMIDMNDKIVTIKDIPSGDFTVNHYLGRIPKFRIILKQIGGGYITDQDRNSTDKLMFLNNGGTIIKELKLLVG